jgi:hypothetical protein
MSGGDHQLDRTTTSPCAQESVKDVLVDHLVYGLIVGPLRAARPQVGILTYIDAVVPRLGPRQEHTLLAHPQPLALVSLSVHGSGRGTHLPGAILLVDVASAVERPDPGWSGKGRVAPYSTAPASIR